MPNFLQFNKSVTIIIRNQLHKILKMQFKLPSTMLTFMLLSSCHQGSGSANSLSCHSIEMLMLSLGDSLPDRQLICKAPSTKCSSSDKRMEGCCPWETTCCSGKSNYVCCGITEICYNTMRGEAFCRMPSPEPTNIHTRID